VPYGRKEGTYGEMYDVPLREREACAMIGLLRDWASCG